MSKFNPIKHRGLVQKLYLIEAKQVVKEYVRDYIIMGSTGNVYTVSIKEIPTCTCPYNKQRYTRCKHIFFVLIRIMGVNEELCEVKKYSEEQLDELFGNIPETVGLFSADQKIKDKYKNTADKKKTEKKTDDVCPICLDELNNGEDVDYCKYACGKSVHTTCFTMWCKKNNAKCVFCRHDWNVKEDDYVNLLD